MNAATLDNLAGGGIAAGGATTATITGDMNNAGSITGSTGLTLASATFENLANAVAGSTTGDVGLTISGAASNAGTILAAGGNVTLNAGSLTNSSGADLGASGTVNSSITGSTTNNGTITGNGGVTLTLAALDNSNGTIASSNGNVGIGATAVTNTSGTLQATNGALTLNANSLTGGGVVDAAGNLSITLASNFNNIGNVTGGTLKFSTTGTLTNSGQMAATNGNATIGATDISNSGILAASALLTITGSSLTNSDTGLIYGSGGINATITGAITNNAGAILADTNTLALTAASLDNVSGLIESTGGDITMTAGTVTNEVAGGVTLSPSNLVYSVTFGNTDPNNDTFDDDYETNNLTGVMTGLPNDPDFAIPDGADKYYFFIVLDPLDPTKEFVVQGEHAAHNATVTGYLSSAAPNGPRALISAADNLTFNNATVDNDASDIVAGGNITFNGGSLNNTAYTSQESFYFSCPGGGKNPGNCTPLQPNDSSLQIPSPPGPPGALGTITGPSKTELWFTTAVDAGAASIVAAGGTVSGNLTGAVSNTSIIVNASSGQRAGYSTDPVAISSSNALTSGAQAVSAAGGAGNLPGIKTGPAVGAITSNGSNGSTLNGNATAGSILGSIPGGNALFVTNPSPDAMYLIESRYQYSEQGLLGSSYLLSRLGDSGANLTFLGDAYFDTQYISQQVLADTGSAYLTGYSSDSDEMAALYNNAATDAQDMGLTLGTALTASQVASLTGDLIWYVNQTVDGKQVLVPELYLAPSSAQIAPSGALIAGNNVGLSGSNITNTAGTITAANALTLNATSGSIQNLASTSTIKTLGGTEQVYNAGGLISSGGPMTLVASNAINNVGSTLKSGGDFNAAAQTINIGASTISTTDLNTAGGATRAYASTTNVGSTVSSGGTLSAYATNGDVDVTASNLTSKSDTNLEATNNVNIGSAANTVDASYNSKNLKSSYDGVSNIGSNVNSGGALTVVAGTGNVNVTASSLAGTGATTLAAGNDVNINAATDSAASTYYSKKTGFLSSSIHSNSSSTQTAVQSLVTGNSVAIAANHNVNITGSDVAAANDVNIAGGNAVNIGATTETDSASSYTSHHGFSAGIQGVGIGIGSYGSSTNQTATSTTQVGSNIGSSTGNTTITAGTAPLTITASTVFAKQNLTLIGPSVDLNDALNSESESETQKQNFTGLTVSLGGAAGAVVGAAQQAAISAQSGNSTLAALQLAEGLTQGYLGYQSYSAAESVIAPTAASDISEDGNATTQAANNASNAEDQAAQIDVSLTASGSKSTNTQSGTQAVGDNLSGNNIVIDATSGNVTATAATIDALNDASIIASQNILLQSGQDTTTSTSSSHSSSGSIGVFVGAGGGYGVQASGSLAESKGNGNSVTQVNTQVAAGNTLTLNSGGNTTLAGAQGSAANIIANVGGNLNIISRQNTSSEKYNANSGSASVSVGAGGGSGSGSFSNTSINDNSATVGAGQQSGLTASQNLTAKVAGNTDLNGGILNAPAGSLTTGSLTSENIHNQYASSGDTIGVSGSTNGYMPSGVLPSGSSTSASGSGTTYGTVAPDIIINAASGIPANLNRDTATANGAVNDNFNLSKSETKLETQQIGAQLFGQAANTAAGTLISQEGWTEDSPQALLLHGLIGVAQAAISGGGNAGAALAGGIGAVAGTAATVSITPALQQYLKNNGIDPNGAEGQLLLTLASSAVGAGAGALADGANAAVGAESGSTTSAYSTRYNQLNEEGEKELAKIECETRIGGCNEGVLSAELNEGVPLNEAMTIAEASATAELGAAALGEAGATSSAAEGGGLTAAQQLAVNRAAGAAFEQSVGASLEGGGLTIGQQISVQTESGITTRLDFLTLDPETGEIGCIECKASQTAPLTPNQTLGFPEIEQSGGTILGAGKPGFPGGMQIPPTAVQIIRGP